MLTFNLFNIGSLRAMGQSPECECFPTPLKAHLDPKGFPMTLIHDLRPKSFMDSLLTKVTFLSRPIMVVSLRPFVSYIILKHIM